MERVACHLANGLHRRGFAVEFVVLRDGGPVRSLLDPGVPVYQVGALPVVGRGARLIAAIPAIAYYLRTRKPRLFHSPGNHTHVAAAQAIFASRYRGAFVPKITNPLLKDGMSAGKRWLRRQFYSRVLERAERVLVLSASGVERAREFGPDVPAKTRFVHNPYICDAMLADTGERAPANPPVLLCVGRLSRQKNQSLLLRAAARLPRQDWIVRLCGTGPDEKELRKLAAELGIAQRVEFTGFVSDPIPEYRTATVMALPSRWEDLPATVLEAIACGCPVVTTASSPALVELLRDVGARAPVPSGDEAELAHALEEALEGKLPVVSKSASLAYGMEAACDEHAAIFAELLGQGPESVPAYHDRTRHSPQRRPGLAPAAAYSRTAEVPD